MTGIPVRDEFLVFGAPKIGDAEIDEVVRTMKSGWLGTGPKVGQFQKEFCDYKNGWGCPVAVNSCTAALHLSLVAAGIGPGDEVITTPMTFCATVNSIVHAGGVPVLADVNRQTFNIDPGAIESKVTSRTKAIVPVHFAGRSCEMDAILEIAQRHNLTIIEDCAHAIETEYKGKPAGTFGEYGCFSFYVTKNVVTGEGGMILARNEVAAQRLKTLGLHGMSKDAWKRFGGDGYKHYQVVECGFKYNMMDLQAAIGIHQLKQVEKFWQQREKVWSFYNTEFFDLPVERPAEIAPDTRHAYHLYTLLVDEEKAGISRDKFLTGMAKQNIGVGVHYESLPEHEFYQTKFGWHPDDYPNARDIGRQTVSIPISAKLESKDLDDVVKAVKALVG
jgi:dTDP-4-amino-4,6-dideoxygalactose transaminase